MRKDYFFIHDTKINYANETDRSSGGGSWLQKKFKHYSYFYKILNALAADGFSVQKDPEVLKRSKRISRDYWIGKRGDLEFCAQKFPSGFEIEFFQNVNYKNQNGGRYDFDKFQKMPYLVRLQYQKYMKKLIDLLETIADVENRTQPKPKTAEDQIKIDLVYGWHFYKDMDFDIHNLDGTAPDQKHCGYHALDKNGKTIRNGDMKYFRNRWNGYLMRGRVYYRANMHWWAIINNKEAVLVDNKDLFDDFPFGEPARLAEVRTPESYKKHKEDLESTKTKELVAELRRRGLKVSVCQKTKKGGV